MVEKSTVTVPGVTISIDIDAMTPQITAPVGNRITADETATLNATVSAVATQTSDGDLAEFTGAAVVGKEINEVGSLLGLVAAIVGLML